MVAVPLAALWVMPAGLIALVLMPFGLDWLAFVPMGWGAEAILYVARTDRCVAGRDDRRAAHAALGVGGRPASASPGLACGAAGCGWSASPVIALGLVSPLLVRPPDLLVSADARLIGVRVQDTVYLQPVSGASKFIRDAWLQYWAAGPPRAMPTMAPSRWMAR